MYDQNRPEEPQRPPGDEKPARRRIGRSWGPAEERAEADDQGGGQAPEQYRFDPDRGRRHRYSEEPTNQMPGVPVEIAETGPSVPATRRPSPGEQFESIPPAPQQPHGNQGPQADSPFAPPGANQEFSAPPGANQDFSPPPQQPQQPQHGPVGEFGVQGAQQFSAPPSAPPGPVSPPAPPVPNAGPSAPRPEHTGQIPQPMTEAGPQQVPSPPGAPTPAPSPPAPRHPELEQGPSTGPIHPPVTEQMPPRTPPTQRQPLAEPTPPVGGEEEPIDAESEHLLELVRQVPGVRDAYHVTGPDGVPSLRLELEEGVDPDKVHTTVSAVVAERRATQPGPVSVGESGEDSKAELEPASAPALEVPVGASAETARVELRRVEIDAAGLDAEVSVTVAVGDYESAGAVTVPPIDWHVQHAAAAATVEAVRPYFNRTEARIEVEHASIVPTGPVRTAVVVVLWMDGESVRRLAGATVVTGERFRAVVSATLSALASEVAH